jgi:hypothetical protein
VEIEKTHPWPPWKTFLGQILRKWGWVLFLVNTRAVTYAALMGGKLSNENKKNKWWRLGTLISIKEKT